MAENTKIEWADHTSNPRYPGVGVRHPMAMLAQRFAVAYVKTPFRTCSERLNVMRFEISTSIITAVDAAKLIAAHHIEAPLAALWCRAKVFPLLGRSVYVAVALSAARRSFPGSLTDQRSRFSSVFNAGPIASASLCRCAHFGAAFGGHR